MPTSTRGASLVIRGEVEETRGARVRGTQQPDGGDAQPEKRGTGRPSHDSNSGGVMQYLPILSVILVP